MLQVAARSQQHLAHIFNAASELPPFERVAYDIALLIHGGLARDKNKISDHHTGAEREVGGWSVRQLRIGDAWMMHDRMSVEELVGKWHAIGKHIMQEELCLLALILSKSSAAKISSAGNELTRVKLQQGITAVDDERGTCHIA